MWCVLNKDSFMVFMNSWLRFVCLMARLQLAIDVSAMVAWDLCGWLHYTNHQNINIATTPGTGNDRRYKSDSLPPCHSTHPLLPRHLISPRRSKDEYNWSNMEKFSLQIIFYLKINAQVEVNKRHLYCFYH